MADAPQPVVLHDTAERVKAKEEAREKGMNLLQKLKKLLHDDPAGRGLERLEDWNGNLDVLKDSIKSREILVGVVGETGLGKSSLINALLGCPIVPTSNSEACTAAVCIFGWNYDITDGKNFRGNITFKSYETVEAELDALKAELADLEDTRKAHGDDPDPEYNDRCAQATRQVKNVASWSGLTQDLVRKSSPEQIIRSSPAFYTVFRNRRGDISDKTFKPLKAVSRENFIDLLTPYVASSTGKLSGTQYWPLVEQVEIFLRSEILRHGIKLVDLPGVMDALESRAQIARDYSERLEKRIVVTPAIRAADNRAAAELLLSEQETLVLDMNDMLKPDSLCVAITKIDDIDCDSAEKEFPTDDIRRICRELKDREEREGDDSGEDDGHGHHDDVYQTGEKRRRGNDALTRKVRQRSESVKPGYGNDYPDVHTEELKSMLKALCIQERNAELKQKVKDNLLATRKKNRKSRATSGTLTEVFPVSSKAFRKFERSRKRRIIEGFPNQESTGIPNLRSWLDQVSLDYREEWVDSDIHHLQVLFDAADGWNQDNELGTSKLTSGEKMKLENSISRLSNTLKEQINQKVRVAIQGKLAALRPLRDTPLKRTSVARKMTKEEPKLVMAAKLLDRAVEGWVKKNPRASVTSLSRHEKTHWSTYRACVRRNGGPFIRPARNGQPKSTIHWMDDVSHAFWQAHFSSWAFQFTRRIPVIKGSIRGCGLKVFTTWVQKILEDEELPQCFRDLLKANVFKLDHLFEKYIADVRARVNKFQETSREKRGILQAAMASRMRPGFEAAIQHKGNGFMKMQTKAVRTHASAVGYNMFETVRNDLELELVGDIKQLSTDVANYWKDEKKGCGTLIKKEMTRLSKRLCGRQVKLTTSEEISVETKNSLSGIIGAWRSDWYRVFIRLPAPTHPLEEFESMDAEEDQQPFLPNVKTETFE
ncbi:uncharacterized protein LY79DRAFT_640598 [Colletotrichum navitas]|uniref:Dynamin N-terminal domain-containing protein n=1 Tax=Colletotrichum navitas TaxID=681940 RepID=A0AAD8UZR4_9PEZI|nr:uncharacterized protein LY79DRAFT_640598 [Colletotrichum navitas]KAK1573927.1 hypothetical protein LY79DRAFT_640598 [Colletotrichum navitas]